MEETHLLCLLKKNSSQVEVVHAFNVSTREAEAGGSLELQTSPFISEFQDSQGYTGKAVSKK